MRFLTVSLIAIISSVSATNFTATPNPTSLSGMIHATSTPAVGQEVVPTPTFHVTQQPTAAAAVVTTTQVPQTGCSVSSGSSSNSNNNICSLIYQEGTQDSACNIINADGSTTLQCYNPKCYTCTKEAQLCPTSAPNACGAACYDPNQYSCNINSQNFFLSTLVQIPGGKNILRLPAICPGSGSPLAGTNGTVTQPFTPPPSGSMVIPPTSAPYVTTTPLPTILSTVAATTAPGSGQEVIPPPIVITLPPQTSAPMTQPPTQAPTQAPTQPTMAVTQAPTTQSTPVTRPTVPPTPATQAPATTTSAPATHSVTTTPYPTNNTYGCSQNIQEGTPDSACVAPNGYVLCYNPACHTCNPDGQLCGNDAPYSCNGACYDNQLYTCTNGQLSPIPGATTTRTVPSYCPSNNQDVSTPAPTHQNTTNDKPFRLAEAIRRFRHN